MSYRRLISIVITLGVFCVSTGQVLKDSVTVKFRQSRVALDTAYMDNCATLEHINKYHLPDSDYILLDVKVEGTASPEGSVRFNNWLSRERAARIYDYVQSSMIVPDSLTSFSFTGRDWRGLRSMVEGDSDVPYRDDVMLLLDEIIARCDNGEKESDGNVQRLKQLHGGVPYSYLYRNVFPYLRRADIVLIYGRKIHKLKQNDFMPSGRPILNVDMPADYIAIPVQQEDKPFYMALKSNMVADALALPEIGAEFYLGKNMTIVGNWMYGWWDNDKSHRYWRAYGGDIALRWWVGSAAHRKPLTGHHVGVYAGVVTYDFEFGGRGYMGGRPGHSLWDRCMKYCGAEYGYSLPIARRLNIDFTIGLGYLCGKYVEYVPKGHCYAWEATKEKHWIGPTKLEVSLVWLIGHGNYNKKGAER